MWHYQFPNKNFFGLSNYPESVYDISEGWERVEQEATEPESASDKIASADKRAIPPTDKSIVISSARIGARGERSVLVSNGARL